jgi:hypothetical protein
MGLFEEERRKLDKQPMNSWWNEGNTLSDEQADDLRRIQKNAADKKKDSWW